MSINHYKKSISSGILYASGTVKDEEGWLNGAIMTGGGADSKVILYDSEDSDLGDKTAVGFISYSVPLFDFAVHCTEGIYAEASGGAEFMVLYD
jgi:hypothetical protein